MPRGWWPTLAEVLQWVHDRGMVHGDVTGVEHLPRRRDRPHLAGFTWPILVGLCDRPELAADGMMLGTAGYVAPELLAGGADPVDPRCDVYALGVVLYELLTGHQPFQGTAAKIVRQVTTTDPRFPRVLKLKRKIPQDLEAICLKALRDPAARYASAGGAGRALRTFLGASASTTKRRRGFWK